MADPELLELAEALRRIKTLEAEKRDLEVEIRRLRKCSLLFHCQLPEGHEGPHSSEPKGDHV